MDDSSGWRCVAIHLNVLMSRFGTVRSFGLCVGTEASGKLCVCSTLKLDHIARLLQYAKTQRSGISGQNSDRQMDDPGSPNHHTGPPGFPPDLDPHTQTSTFHR